jgi:hypothetical protein
VEAFPDPTTLSDEELKQLIHDLEQEENEVSYRRRILQGKIDMLRAVRSARLQKAVAEGRDPIGEVDLARLSEILAGKSSPPPESGGDT